MMEPSRIKVLYCGLIFQLLFVIALPLPYTKYGRSCSDIGCLSSQVCVMAYESCSLGQREGNECGRYPTCKKNTDPSVSAGPSGILSLNPAPENTKVVTGNKDPVYPNMAIDPNYIFGSVQTTRSPFFSSYPQPGAGSPAVFQPLYPPLNQPPVIPQAPFNFGSSPHNPFYPQHPNPSPTSTEPSLWNQFLYNKQPEKRPRSAAPPTLAGVSGPLLLATTMLPFLRRFLGTLAGASNVFNNGPKPSAPVAGNDDDLLGSLGLNPNNPYGQRPTPAPTRPRPPSAPQGPSLYPSLPTDNGPGNRYGGNNGGGGGYSPGGAGGYGGRPAAPGSFDGSGGNIVVPTQKPAAPSSGGGGGFFGGILSGVQNAVSNAVKQQIGTYINQRLGIGPAAGGAAGSGGLGGLLDARNFIDNKRLGGLFAENKPAGGSSPSSSSSVPAGSAIGPGGYPVTVDQRTSASNYNQQYAPQSQYAQNYRHQSAATSNGRARSTERPAYGWTNV